MKKLADPHLICQEVSPPKHLLKASFRYVDPVDLQQARAVTKVLGGNPNQVLEFGGVCTTAFSAIMSRGGFPLPKPVRRGLGNIGLEDVDPEDEDRIKQAKVRHPRTILLPCRDSQGAIVSFCNGEGTWLYKPQPHVANPKRASSEPVRICRTIPEADSIASALNVCAVVLNGTPLFELLERIGRQRWGIAA